MIRRVSGVNGCEVEDKDAELQADSDHNRHLFGLTWFVTTAIEDVTANSIK